MEKILYRVKLYARLIRLDKPIGILLLLWPTLTGLWIANRGVPEWSLLLIFVGGTVLMRSAGCALNDIADRHIDGHVERTQGRPLAAGQVSVKEAVLIALVLTALAYGLIARQNILTQQLSVIAFILAASYPYFKRFFSLPQAYLGIAFGFGIPMGFAATLNEVPVVAWYLCGANIFWTLAYDTQYAMVDKVDDLKIGIKTSAITFGRFDVLAVMGCYTIYILWLFLIGQHVGFGWVYQLGLLGAILCALYHLILIRGRDRAQCFKAFLHNHWLGLSVFLGTALDFVVH